MRNRRSIRLRSWDYSRSGCYFLTICTQNRNFLFGEVVHGKMIVNKNGEIVLNIWRLLPIKFNIKIDAFQIMPNHMHGIVVLNNPVGARFIAPGNTNGGEKINVGRGYVGVRNVNDANRMGVRGVGAINRTQRIGANRDGGFNRMGATNRIDTQYIDAANPKGVMNHMNTHDTGVMCRKGVMNHAPTGTFGASGAGGVTLGVVVRYFKAKCSYELHKNGLNGQIWQRNYYERIIRNEFGLTKTREYILNNPLNWARDLNHS